MTEIEVDEMLRLVSDVTAEIPAHDAMPRRVVLQKAKGRKIMSRMKDWFYPNNGVKKTFHLDHCCNSKISKQNI